MCLHDTMLFFLRVLMVYGVGRGCYGKCYCTIMNGGCLLMVGWPMSDGVTSDLLMVM